MKNRFGLFGGISLAVMMSVSVISAQERQPAPDNVMFYKIEQERMMQEHTTSDAAWRRFCFLRLGNEF